MDIPIRASGRHGAIAAPHGAAAKAGYEVLREGGSAIEAMVAAAATIAVVYPHMNGIGGDGFWLISKADGRVTAIEACGRAAQLATVRSYIDEGSAIPPRGPRAALTVPMAVAGWRAALDVESDRTLPLDRLLSDAIRHARDGIVVTASQSRHTQAKHGELLGQPGFAPVYMPNGGAPAAGATLRQPALATTLAEIAASGLGAFYDGEIADKNADFLEAVGSPLRLSDFNGAQARQVAPLSTAIAGAKLFNMPPPTQGIASLLILAIYDRLGPSRIEGFDHVHRLVEATKQAFRLRNHHVGDPDYMTADPAEWLEPETVAGLAAQIDPSRASPWPDPPVDGGTIWMGACDALGTVVSYIQSIYWEFGSGVLCPETGVVFQNRGSAFSLMDGPNVLRSGARPLHTLNPAIAHFADGRRLAYGTMGGEGQPQTQAAVFSRYAHMNTSLADAIAAPRWLLGRTWGDVTTTLKLEERFGADLTVALKTAGHDVEQIPDFDDMTGHAGAVVRHPGGDIEAAHDPRADGGAIAW